MRLGVEVAAVCLSIIGLAVADDVRASIKKSTNIPAEDLAFALQTLAKDRNFQVVYVSEEVNDVRTQGAVGELSSDEALKQLLKGTGLGYRYLDEKTVTIVVVRALAGFSTATSSARSAAAQGSAAEEGSQPGSFWDKFLLAQTTSGQAASSSTVANKNEQSSNKESEELQEVVVTGYRFLSVDTSGTTNLPLPIEQVPQSISLVSNDFIEAANLKTLGEIAEYTPGAINFGNPANNGSVIELRGFSAGQAVDGLPINISNSGTSYEPDYAIFDRLEVVKGPTSVVYGVSSPGGLVNFVTKSATPQTVDYISAQVGSWNNYRLEGQAAGSLDSAGGVRAIGVVVRDQGDSFTDVLKHAKTSIYGGINVDVTDSVTAYLHGGYERYVRTQFDGIPTLPDGSPAPVPRSFFIGASDINLTSSVYHAEGDLTWHVTDLWELGVKGNYQHGENKGSDAYGFGLQDNGDLSLSAFRFDLPGTGTLYRNYAIGASSIYHLDALGIKDSFVSLAALYQDSHTGFAGLSPPGTGTLHTNIFDGESVISQALDSLVAASASSAPYATYTDASTATYSGQAVLKLIDPLTLLLGLAYSKPEATQESTGAAQQDFSFSGQMTYRAGITYAVVPGVNAYLSYSQSFSPQLLTSLGTNGVASFLPPLIGEQYETGLKYRSGDGQLLVTGALFQIKQKNQGEFQTFLNGVDYYTPVGEVTHKGLELATLGRITSRWQVNAGYTYLDPTVTRDVDPALVGQTTLYLPKQTWSLYTTYALPDRILPGLSLGGGIRYVSSERTSYGNTAANNAAGLSPTQDLPSYTLVDVTASYVVNKWLVQLNARNIFNKYYFINNYQTLFFGNEPGEPANVTLTIRRQF